MTTTCPLLLYLSDCLGEISSSFDAFRCTFGEVFFNNDNFLPRNAQISLAPLLLLTVGRIHGNHGDDDGFAQSVWRGPRSIDLELTACFFFGGPTITVPSDDGYQQRGDLGRPRRERASLAIED